MSSLPVEFQSDVDSKSFAVRLATMIGTGLINYKHYYRWVDRLIAAMEFPPQWILELSTIKYSPDAVAAARRFAYSEPFESFDEVQISDESIACLLLKYESRAISWATFLHDAGGVADRSWETRVRCEYYYEMLNELEDSDFSWWVERRQRNAVRLKFSDTISAIRPVYIVFRKYFRELVNQ